MFFGNQLTRNTAAAMTAGLAAYFLKLSRLNLLKNSDGTSVNPSPLGIKSFILNQAFSRQGTEFPGIFNAVHPGWEFCPWDPNRATRHLRRQENAQCVVPVAKPSTTFAPLDVQKSVCHKKASFPGHADIYGDVVKNYAGSACTKFGKCLKDGSQC